MEALDFLLYPFLSCVALVLIHAYFGIHILERGIIFVDIALAQFIGIGISYKLDLPTAPMTVASLSLVFFLLLIMKAVRRDRRKDYEQVKYCQGT